eukprot:SAG22_NODE_2802_length_2199_cov_1.524286_3_plen_111_part_00
MLLPLPAVCQVDEVKVAAFALITVGSFLIIMSMLDCLAAWHDDESAIKCMSDMFMYLVMLTLAASGVFLAFGSQVRRLLQRFVALYFDHGVRMPVVPYTISITSAVLVRL